MQRARTYKKKPMKGKYTSQLARRSFKRNKNSTALLSGKQTIRIRCETVMSVRADATANTVTNQNSNSIWNLTEIINSYSWTLLNQDFLKYKIYGITIRASPTHDSTNLCDGLASVPMAIALYPTYTNFTVTNNEVMNNDTAFYIEPHLTTPQVKTWYFPDNYYEASSSGLGVWTSTASIATQVGELAIGNYVPFLNFATDKTLYMLRITFLLQLGMRRV